MASDANGNTVTFVYDHLGRVKTATYSGGLVLTYTYTGEGALYSITATENGNTTTYLYGYDSLGRLISGERLDNGTSILRTRQAYDEVNRPVYQAWQVGGTLYEEGYTYNSTQDGSLNTHHTATGQTLTMQYDGLRRLSGITGGIYGKTYTYRDVSTTQTTTQIASVVYDLPTDQSYGYTYDNMGNIATYTDTNGTVTYTYDAQGQLLSATDGTTTYTYTYDTVGNILTANGHTYSYTNGDWKDLLTAYDGETITYDAIGNPLSYYNGTRWTFTWEDGRQLATATDGTTNVSYTYDSDGIRTSKTVNGVTHTYVYASGRLLRETFGDTTLDFFYSTSGQPYALSYNGVTYYYITNLQGDVMQIVNADGEVVASYQYDPYGNIISASGELAEVNPLRYRGYIYDSETDLYYLQSRYYDSSVGRFLNADAFASTGQGIIGNNMFAYCLNNPVDMSDHSGCWPQWIEDIWEEIKDFFSSDTNSIGGEFEDGALRGAGSLTAGYGETNNRLQVNSKNGNSNGMLGLFGKLSVVNASGKFGVGNKDASLYVKGVCDILTASGQAGLQYENGAGLAVKAKASVVSGRATTEFNLFGWQIEVGASGDLLSVGGEAMIGVFPDEGFTANASLGAGLFGLGFIIRVKPPQ